MKYQRSGQWIRDGWTKDERRKRLSCLFRDDDDDDDEGGW